MKASALVVLLLLVCGAVVQAQSSDVTIAIEEGTPEYCLASYGGAARRADDIELRLPLKVQYENHRSDTIYLPLWAHYSLRMTVAGQGGSTLLRNATRGIDVKAVMALPRPDATFLVIDGKRAVSSSSFEGTVIPVLDLSHGVDLRGKTVQLVMTRDFQSLSPQAEQKLNEKWKDYGTVWTGFVESNMMTLYISKEPLSRDCNIPLPK
jgi:hypothetical protein